MKVTGQKKHAQDVFGTENNLDFLFRDQGKLKNIWLEYNLHLATDITDEIAFVLHIESVCSKKNS